MNTTTHQSNLISIADAAARFGISRRTIERWVRAGELDAFSSEADRRKRLLDVTAVETLVKESSQRRNTRRRSSAVRLPDSFPDDHQESLGLDYRNGQSVDPIAAQRYERIVDNALQLVYSHYHRLASQLAPEAFQQLTLDQLRSGPLGQDLLRLARLARGQNREPQELVLEAIDSVLQLLFWPVAADDYTVPRTFWDTDLGRMLALAKFRAYDTSELVSIGNAAQQLGVTRPTIYQWIDERLIDSVRDDTTRRTFVVRRDVDKILRLRKSNSKGSDRNGDE